MMAVELTVNVPALWAVITNWLEVGVDSTGVIRIVLVGETSVLKICRDVPVTVGTETPSAQYVCGEPGIRPDPSVLPVELFAPIPPLTSRASLPSVSLFCTVKATDVLELLPATLDSLSVILFDPVVIEIPEPALIVNAPFAFGPCPFIV